MNQPASTPVAEPESESGNPPKPPTCRGPLHCGPKSHTGRLTQVDRSWALALLAGLGRDTKSGVTKDEARTFADQSVAALHDAINAGWNGPNELKETDFDALRSRDDFKKLLAELEAKAGPKAKTKD